MFYSAEQLEARRAACRRWRARNPEKQRAATQKWADANKERIATYKKDPEKVKQWARDYRRRVPDYSIRRYGITLSRFIDLVKLQEGKCVICMAQVQLCVDHNHNTGKIRGLLCRKCNAGLGLFQESPENLSRAASYLREELMCSE